MYAEIDKVLVCLKFKEACMSNNVAAFSSWLNESYNISQTLDIPVLDPDTRSVSKPQLLASMGAVEILYESRRF